MKLSKLFTKTRKDISKDEVSINAQLLERAGFISKEMAGVYNFLPLGLKTLRKIIDVIRKEMDDIGANEILMPTLTSIENYKKTGRDRLDILFQTKLHSGSEFILNQSHEEVVTPLLQNFINSYKDLPVATYQIQTKFRNEPRAKSGLLRGREFLMKDLYSFHADESDLDKFPTKKDLKF
jgi:prolyl-tRNA synthetase